MQLRFTFYHWSHNKFFGRTYTANKVRGTCERGIFSAKNLKENLYFHSKTVNEFVYVVVDTVVIRTRLDRDDVYFSAGYYLGKLYHRSKY